MKIHWFKKARLVIPVTLSIVLLLALACGSTAPAAEPTPVPPTATAVTTAPTAIPQATAAIGDGNMGGGDHAPSFAQFWQPPTAAYGDPISGGHLRIIYEDPLDHANAWGAGTGTTDRYRSPTMNILVQENPYDFTGEAIPDLAESWTIHDDNMGVTFYFHEGITWHNGAAFTCEDARFSVETMVTAEGLTNGYMKGRLTHLDASALACEDEALNMRFNSPSSIPLLALTNRRAYIFNKAWFEAGGETAMFQDVSLGTGAFIWEPGQKVGVDTQRFEKNPDYFFGDGSLPYLDQLTIVGILDESAQQAALLSHQADWHWVRNFGQYRAYVDHEQIQTVIRPTRGHFQFWMNIRNEPFDNVRVRQAIVMGLDRAAGITVLQDGNGSMGFPMAPGGAWELDDARGCAVPGWCAAADMDAQRAEARQMLAEEGFDFDKVYLFTVESDAQVVGRATFVQEQLRLLGIKTDFDVVETVAYRVQEQGGTWGDFLPRNSTMSFDDPSAGMGAYTRCVSIENRWTPGSDCDVKLEALMDQADGTTDRVERKRISDEIQLYVMEQYMWFPLYWEQEAVAWWPEVKGYAHFPTPYGSWLKYQHMWLDPTRQDEREFSGQTTGYPGGI